MKRTIQVYGSRLHVLSFSLKKQYNFIDFNDWLSYRVQDNFATGSING